MTVEVGWIAPLRRWVVRTPKGIYFVRNSPVLRRLDKTRRYRGKILNRRPTT